MTLVESTTDRKRLGLAFGIVIALCVLAVVYANVSSSPQTTASAPTDRLLTDAEIAARFPRFKDVTDGLKKAEEQCRAIRTKPEHLRTNSERQFFAVAACHLDLE